MTKFNADFWEVTISERSWQRFSTGDHLYHEEPDEEVRHQQRHQTVAAMWARVEPLLDEVLTAKQQEIVRRYYFEGLNQRQIAEELGIAQQSVSEHLYGKARNGHIIGGAIPKLRKACAKRGIDWEG